MSQRKIRNLLFVFWGGLFLFTQEPVFIWLFVGSLVLFSSSEEKSKKTSHSYFARMKRDAKEFGLQIPSQRQLRNQLKKVYELQENSFKEYPHLKEEYQQITRELWLSLSHKKSVDEWSYIITSTLESWPGGTTKATPSKLGKKLEEVSELTRQWNEAKSEALGGQHV